MTKTCIVGLGLVLVCFGASYAERADEIELPARLLAPEQVEPISADEFQQVLAHHRGEVVLVNLWATWCIPCVQELPDLNLLQERFRDRGLRVLAVSFDDIGKLDDRVRPFFAEKAPALVSYLQTEDDQFTFVEPLDEEWIGAMPTSFFIDRTGEIVKRHTGRLLYRDLEKVILALLDEPAQP